VDDLYPGANPGPVPLGQTPAIGSGLAAILTAASVLALGAAMAPPKSDRTFWAIGGALNYMAFGPVGLGVQAAYALSKRR
jgi:integral membrane sensor domain MASE1